MNFFFILHLHSLHPNIQFLIWSHASAFKQAGILKTKQIQGNDTKMKCVALYCIAFVVWIWFEPIHLFDGSVVKGVSLNSSLYGITGNGWALCRE